MSKRILLLVIVLIALPRFAASASLTPAVQSALDAFHEQFGTRWVHTTTPDGRAIATLTGVPSGPALVGPDGGELVPLLRILGGGGDEVVFEDEVLETTIGPIRRYTRVQKLGREPIENAAIVMQRSDDGRGAWDIILNTAIPSNAPLTAVRSAEEARDLVKAHLLHPETRSEYAIADFGTGTLEVDVDIPPPAHLAMVRGSVRRVYEVLALVNAVTGCGKAPIALRQYSIDATTADPRPDRAIVRFKDLIRPFRDGKGKVFDPNPINTLKLSRLPDALAFDLSLPPYFERKLLDLNDPNGLTYALTGRYAAVRDFHCPDSSPMTVTTQSANAVPDFSVARGGFQFAAVNSYYHVDTMARWVTSLKFGDTVPDAFPIDVDGGSAGEPQSFYVPSSLKTDRHIWLMKSEFDIYVAEDAEWLAHEYAHAILDHKTNGYFAKAPAKKDVVEACAINEGFADYWALSTFATQTAASGHDLRCFGEWPNKARCRRQYPLLSHAFFNDNSSDHANGDIWAGMLFSVFRAVGSTRDVADAIILQGHLTRAIAGEAPTMKSMAEGIVIADGHRFAGAHRAALCAVFKRHDIWPIACCAKRGCTESWNNAVPVRAAQAPPP
jgi:Fungalysin metallopeptidase (M36)